MIEYAVIAVLYLVGADMFATSSALIIGPKWAFIKKRTKILLTIIWPAYWVYIMIVFIRGKQ